MSARTSDQDVLTGYNFIIEIDGYASSGWSKMSALGISFDIVEYRTGGDNATKKKRQGLATFPDITFEKGIVLAKGMGSADTRNWTQQTFDVAKKIQTAGNSVRRTIAVKVRNPEGILVIQHKIVQCIIKSANLQSELDSNASNVLMENLVISHEGFSSTYL